VGFHTPHNPFFLSLLQTFSGRGQQNESSFSFGKGRRGCFSFFFFSHFCCCARFFLLLRIMSNRLFPQRFRVSRGVRIFFLLSLIPPVVFQSPLLSWSNSPPGGGSATFSCKPLSYGGLFCRRPFHFFHGKTSFFFQFGPVPGLFFSGTA